MSDQFICDTFEVRNFIGKVKDIVARTDTDSFEERLAAIQPHFNQIMVDPYWLPESFRRTSTSGGMGKGIAKKISMPI